MVRDRRGQHLFAQGGLQAPIGQLELNHCLIILHFHHLGQALSLAGKPVGVDGDLDLAGGDFAPHATDQAAVGAAETAGANIVLAIAFVTLADRPAGGIAQQHAPRAGPRIAQRAERACRFLHNQVDISVTQPGDLDDAISGDGLVQGGLVSRCLSVQFLGLQFIQGGLGGPEGIQPHVLMLLRQGLAEDAHGGPLDALGVLQLLCDFQACHVGFRPLRCQGGRLTVDAQGPSVQAVVFQLDPQGQEVDRLHGEICGRHQYPLDLLAGFARGFQGQRHPLIHPRLGRTVPQRRTQQAQKGVEFLGGQQAAHGLAYLGGFRLLLEVPIPDRVRWGVDLTSNDPIGRLQEGRGCRGGIGTGLATRSKCQVVMDAEGAEAVVTGVRDVEHAAAESAHATHASTEATHASTEATHASTEATHAAHATAESSHTTHHSHAAHHAHPSAHRVRRHHKVGHRIDLEDEVGIGLLWGRDQQHFVFDDISQIQVAEQQAQGGSQRDPSQALRHRCATLDAQRLEGLVVQLDFDPVPILEIIHDFRERRVREV